MAKQMEESMPKPQSKHKKTLTVDFKNKLTSNMGSAINNRFLTELKLAQEKMGSQDEKIV